MPRCVYPAPALLVAALLSTVPGILRAQSPAAPADMEEGVAAPPDGDGSDSSGSNAAAQAPASAASKSAPETSGPEMTALASEEPSGVVAEPAPPLWMDVYGEGVRSSHEENNAAGFTEAKTGKRFNLGRPFDVYVKARLGRDQKAFFWNNRADVGVGARVHLLDRVSLILFGEAVAGHYFRTEPGVFAAGGIQMGIERNRAALESTRKEFQAVYARILEMDPFFITPDDPKYEKQWKDLKNLAQGTLDSLTRLDNSIDALEAVHDSLMGALDTQALLPSGPLWEYRGGLVFWHGWGQRVEGGNARPAFAFPLRFWGEVYSDCIYSALRRHVQSRNSQGTLADSVAHLDNLIAYANPDAGVVLMEGPAGDVAVYATAYLWLDTHADWWNNRAMAGPGLRYKPFGSLDLAFTGEYLFGRYYGRERNEDPNPHGQAFQDLRLSLSFWYGLGL